ncbi:hypothetical protein [uncultured Roseibium sp.]|uniref:hypothetical protein n=1 Tax=uncultured Roseibium sp. TaxID=1936171 RepID=UPI00263204E1|nr:hypothetical protein [uncultured Roseibium sp.]
MSDEKQPFCGTYEVGQIRIMALDGQENLAKGVVPGEMTVTSAEFSYVPNNPDENALDVTIEAFATVNSSGDKIVHIEDLKLLLQSDTSYWATEGVKSAFTVEDAFEMSVKMRADKTSLAPGRLYVRFHCEKSSEA